MASLATICMQLAVVATAIKLLLVPAYRSTDFEVHRNWLAITHSLPISKWYVEATSEWTLDYPPLFAWFEWLLSQLAKLVDPAMLVVQNLEYDSPGTVLFQRGTVIATDVVLLTAVYALARLLSKPPAAPAAASPSPPSTPSPPSCDPAGVVLFLLVGGNAGLLLLDHVHFQYNGVMMGILLWSLYAALTGRHLLSGLLFALLLNMKHLFLYAAPAYFVYLLRHYCFTCTAGDCSFRGSSSDVSSRNTGSNGVSCRTRLRSAVQRLAVLGGVVIAVFAVSLGPFVALGQTQQLLRRLFPFGRGLLHAYWAANAWAPYAAADKVLAVVLPRLLPRLQALLPGLLGGGNGVVQRLLLMLQKESGAANMAGGRVGVSYFSVLPQITPAATAIAVLLALLPCLVALWRGAGDGCPSSSSSSTNPSCSSKKGGSSNSYIFHNLVRAVSYSYLCGFVFGYHVHEKAVLVALLPLAIDAVRSRTAARRFLILSSAGHYGLLPLLYRPQEYGVKILLVLSHFVLSVLALNKLYDHESAGGQTASLQDRRQQQQGQQREKSSRSGAPLTRQGSVLGWLSWCYLAGFVLLELYCYVVHNLIPLLHERLPFVPLMLTSVYCSLGVLAVWGEMAAEWAVQAIGKVRG
ncbi:hypothetical protein Agub_g3803 [Astrephomene gubernaculifera]|uniref:Alpha-1,3-glucosyltransferase n=1 Tax=Astrephomene gubernaculifera TaxID=47775 RepID=A0AAD3HJP6_9CHLO|nr:hypothetical protein Agub_g3803 [Astrephomene gubernaculifera]